MYMNTALGIAAVRVSTDKQFHEGDSIDNQAERIKRTAENDGVDIVKFFVEHYSGRKTDRTVVDEMLAYLDDNPDVKWVYINEINRFSRGGGDIYLNLKLQLIKRGVELRDVTGIIQKSINTLDHLGDGSFEYEWSRVSPSRPAEVMQAEYARQDVTQILTRMIGQEIRLAGQGYQVRVATFGYRNVRITRPDGKKAMIMEPLEPEASWVRKIFELRAEGGWTDEAIVEHINAMGYRSRKQHRRDKETGRVIGIGGMKPLHAKQLRRVVQLPAYAGIKQERWTNYQPIKSQSPGLVSIALWNRANLGAQKIIEHEDGTYTIETGESRNKRSWKENPEFLLRHVVRCDQCSGLYWASKSTGKSGNRFGYFHCARGHKRVSHPQAEFEQTIGKYLESVQFKPGFLGLFREAVREVWITKNKSHQNETAMVDQHIADLKLKQSNTLDRITVSGSELVQRKLEEEVEALEQAILDAEKKRPSAWLTEQQIEAFFQMARERLEQPAKVPTECGTQAQIEDEWATIFSKLPTYSDFKTGTPQLSLIYRLGSDSKADKRQMVHELSRSWNTFQDEVRLWLELHSLRSGQS